MADSRLQGWRRWAFFVLLALTAFLAGLLLSFKIYGYERVLATPIGQSVMRVFLSTQAKPGRDVALDENAPLPALQLTDLDGHPAPLPGDGRVRLINYWASWCGPCVEEMPLLDTYATSQDEVLVIGIALEPYADAKRFGEAMSLSFPLLAETPRADDSSALLGNAAGVLPYSVLIDGQGRRLAAQVGPFANAEHVREWVESNRPR